MSTIRKGTIVIDEKNRPGILTKENKIDGFHVGETIGGEPGSNGQLFKTKRPRAVCHISDIESKRVINKAAAERAKKKKFITRFDQDFKLYEFIYTVGENKFEHHYILAKSQEDAMDRFNELHSKVKNDTVHFGYKKIFSIKDCDFDACYY